MKLDFRDYQIFVCRFVRTYSVIVLMPQILGSSPDMAAKPKYYY